jgi:hypothetical protein
MASSIALMESRFQYLSGTSTPRDLSRALSLMTSVAGRPFLKFWRISLKMAVIWGSV